MPWKGIFGIFSSAQSLRDLQILTPTFYKLDLYLKKKKKKISIKQIMSFVLPLTFIKSKIKK